MFIETWVFWRERVERWDLEGLRDILKCGVVFGKENGG